MKTYLFLWNPQKDTYSFKDYDKVQSEARAGRAYSTRWICPSTRPRPGDIAILQRTGPHNNGVFARGIVTSTPGKDDYGVRCLRLKLDEFLPLGEEISRQEIVTKAKYKEKWMPMASGNLVPEQLVQAIQSLWVERSQPDFSLPDEVQQPEGLFEGSVSEVKVNAYERNSQARKLCITHYGLDCSVCGFNFETAYGKAGSGIIHVHHLKPLHKIGKKYEVDPIKDLRPVCPNCHAMIHTKRPAYTFRELKALLRKS